MKSMKIAVILPTYNEKENIKKLVPTLSKVFKKNKINGEVIIVDDNSPDGTGDAAELLAKKYPVRTVHRNEKLGIGSAYVAGMNATDADIFFTMDADLQHDPEIIPTFLPKLKNHDIVIGARYTKGGKMNLCWYRKMVSKGANTLVQNILGIPVPDVTSGYRAYNRKILKTLRKHSISSKGYVFLTEILFYALKDGAKVTEVPIIFNERQIGNSKLTKFEMVLFFYRVGRLRLKSLKD